MSKRYSLFFFLGLFVAGTFFLSSCQSTKNITRRRIKPIPFHRLYTKMETHAPNFRYFSGKLGIHYQKGNGEPLNFRVQIRAKRDSLIWMSLIPAMGIEAARVVLTTDSVKMLNRMKKNYVIGSYQLIDSLMHTRITFSMIQALLFARVVDGPIIDSSATTDNGLYLLKMKIQLTGDQGKTHVLEQKAWLNPEDFTLHRLELNDSRFPGKKMIILYNTYQTVSNTKLPLKMQVIIRAKEKLVIDISFKKAEINVPHHFPFIVPSKYKRLL
ncbi:DUF4292 domain-containing protein [Candidatus Sulfidibacterium hydrothermale]|uniref:DUF4292 domain-containing protein n=1 Tax=Candidatus Sulfidibacterium hydrothermale TaxID=2875962 RepID=UPI001F0B39C3|nr:DUF4292 domain-containing protein [Candidatus Sulfidibacterium hydrothermale]UBM62599.1 DUF4292 domain-containing protein [Candidatus Sulfidibacterium hydrothermale]